MRVHTESGLMWPIQTVTLTIQDPGPFNRRLAEIILEEEQKTIETMKPTEVAGIKEGLTAYWLKFNVLNWRYPEIDVFREITLSGIRQWLNANGDTLGGDLRIAGISCWANVLRYGEHLSIHHHDPAFLSGHYQVQSGLSDDPQVPNDSAATIYYRPGFMDRSMGGKASMSPSPWDDGWQIQSPPEEGRFFFFPSFVRHEVRTYLGKTHRISIALDVFMKSQNLQIYFGGPRWFVPKE